MSIGFAWAQKNSVHGYVHTPQGHLHTLIIIVRYEDRSMMRDKVKWPNVSEEGVLPRFATGPNNRLFYQDTTQFTDGKRVHNLSDFFYTMSHGQFKMTADIYPIQVPIKQIPLTRTNYFSRLSQMNQMAVEWIQENDSTFDWSKYDRRTNNPFFSQDNQNSLPDGKLDYVIFMHRDQGLTGIGNPGNFTIPGTNLRMSTGHTYGESYPAYKHNWIHMLHELAHNLYRAPHVLGANSADGNYFYTQKGWGMMAGWHSPFFVANAWESWWQGWIEVKTIDQSGIYELKDYVTSGEAIRIPVGDKGDYFWLENHQKMDPWDKKLFYRNPTQGMEESAKGLYAYTVNPYGSDRAKPALNPFNPRHVNIIRMHNAEGNFDFTLANKDRSQKTHIKVASNPFSGQNDFQFIRMDYDGDGNICLPMMHGNKDGKSCDQQEIWSEIQDDTLHQTYGNTGDQNDALVVGDEIGLSGIFPITNYPAFDPKKECLQPYILSGISIEMLGKQEDGSMVLDIDLNDWELRQSQRWCGSLTLPDSVRGNYIESPLRLTRDVTIRLSLSGTPNRRTIHPKTGTFANPTSLEVEGDRSIVVERGANLVIETNSELRLLEKGTITVRSGGRIQVEGDLDLGTEGKLIVERGGDFILPDEGNLKYLEEDQLSGRLRKR